MALALAYVLLSLGITGSWIYIAKTEADGSGFNSIVKAADGTARVPFVKRRLLPDLARGLAFVVPEFAWDGLKETLKGTCAVVGLCRPFIDGQRWQPKDFPVLFSAYFLIWLSVLALLFTCRKLILLLYECPRWLADVLAGLVGLAVLGGCGYTYKSYPYDLPNCFLFTLTITAMIARRWWFILPFVAAVYSKETAVLLIAGYALLAGSWRSLRFATVLNLSVLGAIYLGARLIIDYHYPSVAGEFWGGFWYPGRNAETVTGFLIFYSWALPFVAVCAYRMARLWPSYPWTLKRLIWLAAPLLTLGFFRGLFEEKRQYLEVMPIAGLMVAQWVLHEWGLGRLLVARARVKEASASDPIES